MTTPNEYAERIAELKRDADSAEDWGAASRAAYAAIALASELAEKLREAEGNYRFMVENAANVKLDGYRDLGERVAKAEAERDGSKRAADEHLLEAASLAADNVRLEEQLAETKRELEQERERGPKFLRAHADMLNELNGSHAAGSVALCRELADKLERGETDPWATPSPQPSAPAGEVGSGKGERCSECGGSGRILTSGGRSDIYARHRYCSCAAGLRLHSRDCRCGRCGTGRATPTTEGK